MGILAINASPRIDGQTNSLVAEVLSGAMHAGADGTLVHLAQSQLSPCRACRGGWGPHYPPGQENSNDCLIRDDFAALQEKVRSCSLLVFGSPVYFGDISELAKTFLDRLRRCNWPPRQSPLQGKQVVILACGDKGNGAVEAVAVLEKYFLTYMGMERTVSLAVTSKNRPLMLASAAAAGAAFAFTNSPH